LLSALSPSAAAICSGNLSSRKTAWWGWEDSNSSLLLIWIGWIAIPVAPEPIEMPFSKLKADLRKAAERTIPRLRRRIGRFAATLTAREASNYFRHAGYA
jgi:hypothetical protein